MSTPNTVTQADITAILSRARIEVTKSGEKTCVLHVTLANGFEMVESSSCVDPANYDEEIGLGICRKRITDRLWLLEGWRLACRLGGDP
jgi:hypothetical protein